MKQLSYREKIVLLVVTIFLVVLIFVMWPIKTIRGNITEHEKKYETVKTEFDNNNRLIDEIPVIEGNITKIYDKSKDLNKEFIVHNENFQIDQYLQKFVNDAKFIDGDKNKFEITGSFKQENAKAKDLEFYYYSPVVVTYPILENADVNGNLLATTDNALYKKVTNAVCMSNLEKQNIEIHSASADVKFTREGLFAFIDGLKEQDTGVRVVSVTIGDYTFGQLENENITLDPAAADMKGYTTAQVKFEFYTMQQIQKPVFD